MQKNYISPMISVQTIETVSVLCASGGRPADVIQFDRSGTAISDAF